MMSQQSSWPGHWRCARPACGPRRCAACGLPRRPGRPGRPRSASARGRPRARPPGAGRHRARTRRDRRPREDALTEPAREGRLMDAHPGCQLINTRATRRHQLGYHLFAKLSRVGLRHWIDFDSHRAKADCRTRLSVRPAHATSLPDTEATVKVATASHEPRKPIVSLHHRNGLAKG